MKLTTISESSGSINVKDSFWDREPVKHLDIFTEKQLERLRSREFDIDYTDEILHKGFKFLGDYQVGRAEAEFWVKNGIVWTRETGTGDNDSFLASCGISLELFNKKYRI